MSSLCRDSFSIMVLQSPVAPQAQALFSHHRVKVGFDVSRFVGVDRVWCIKMGSDASMLGVAQVIAEFMDPIILVPNIPRRLALEVRG